MEHQENTEPMEAVRAAGTEEMAEAVKKAEAAIAAAQEAKQMQEAQIAEETAEAEETIEAPEAPEAPEEAEDPAPPEKAEDPAPPEEAEDPTPQEEDEDRQTPESVKADHDQSSEDYQHEQLQQARRLRRLEQKRRRKRQQRLVLGALLLVVVLVVLLIVRGCVSKKAPPVIPGSEQAEARADEQTPIVETEPDTIINIAAVGDIMCYQDQMDACLQADGSYDFSPAFAAVSGHTISADLTVGNLELNFCGQPYSGKPDFRAPDALADTLAAIGFDVLQTANTYSIQNGLTGLRSTIGRLNAVGISHVGTYAVQEDKTTNEGVLLKNVSGVKIAFLSYTKGLNGLRLPDGSEFAVDLFYSDYDTDFKHLDTVGISRSVEAAKALDPDIIIAMLHWGNEGSNERTEAQNKLAELLFENGVDAILGTHSHIVGELESRTVNVDGREKTCFVAWSLGNFYSSMSESYAQSCRNGIVLNLEFTKNGETGETSLTGVTYTPVYFCDTEDSVREDEDEPGEEPRTRFEVLPIRSALSSGLFPDRTETFTQAISDLRKATNSDFDSGK